MKLLALLGYPRHHGHTSRLADLFLKGAAAAGEQGLKIQPHVEIDALPMAVAILARLPVATVLPASAVAHEIADGELSAHPIVEPTISRRLFLIYSGERALSEPERSLVNTLRRSLSEQRRAD